MEYVQVLTFLMLSITIVWATRMMYFDVRRRLNSEDEV